MELQRTIGDVASLVGGTLEGADGGRAGRVLAALRPLDAAGPDDLAPVLRARFAGAAGRCRAQCLVVGEGLELPPREGRVLIRVTDAEAAVDAIAARWGPREEPFPVGVHPAAIVEAGAEVDPTARVGPWVFVGAGARVGARTRLFPGVYLGARARIGCDGVLHAHVVVGHDCVLGDRVVVFAGAVIGADGFGFRQDARGCNTKVPHAGHVVIGDDVEIGANTTVDRGRLDATVVGDDCKLDDHVHVAHNCVLGRSVVIAGHSSMAGSTRFGDGVLVGGAARFNGHITIGAGARIGGNAGVTKDVPPGAYVAGFPARPGTRWAREMAALSQLPEALARQRGRGAPDEAAPAPRRAGGAPEGGRGGRSGDAP